MTDRDALIEKLAAIEHERRADWQRYLYSRCTQAGHNGLVIRGDEVAHWNRQIATPYADLSEVEKQSDRDQVMRYLPLVVNAVATWIEEDGGMDHAAIARAARWLSEMNR